MNKPEVVRLLMRAATVDARVDPTDEAVIEGWLWLAGTLDYADAMGALKVHYTQAPDTVVKPGHLIAIVQEWDGQWVQAGRSAAARPRGNPDEQELISGDELGRVIEACGGWENYSRLLATGQPLPAAIAAPGPADVVDAEICDDDGEGTRG